MMVVAVVTDRNGAHDDGGEGDGDQIQDDGSDQWSLITMVLMMVVVRVMVIMLVM